MLADVQGTVHLKMKLLSSFTHRLFIPNLYGFLSSAEHNILKNVGNN